MRASRHAYRLAQAVLILVSIFARINAQTSSGGGVKCDGISFGVDCALPCNCNGRCDEMTARCLSGQCLETWSGPTCQLKNIAKYKDTATSGTQGLYTSNLAVDGDRNSDYQLGGSCAVVWNADSPVPWWTVDLHDYYLVSRMRIYNVAVQELQRKLTGFYVIVGNTSTPGPTSSVLCYEHMTGTAGDVIDIACNNPVVVRYVTVQLPLQLTPTMTAAPSISSQAHTFYLCEVEIYGCAPGSFGRECSRVCGHCHNNQPCDAVTGICINGCEPGWSSTHCNLKCHLGWYGEGCRLSCKACRAKSTCDYITGVCEQGCAEGWSGYHCDIVCPAGQCVTECGHCKDNSLCDTKYNTGQCPGQCAQGWMGKKCNTTCLKGMYGQNCSSKCGWCKENMACHHITGTCLSGCQDGWLGDFCQDFAPPPDVATDATAHEDEDVAVIVGGAFAALIAIAIILFITVYIYRKKNCFRVPPGNRGLTNHMNGLQGRCGESREGGDSLVMTSSSDNKQNFVNGIMSLMSKSNTHSDDRYSNTQLFQHPIPVEKLKEYVQNRKSLSSGWEIEFDSLPTGSMAYADIANLPFNRGKNRFPGVLPYDDNRVILETSDGDPLFEYINASYIDGYHLRKAYIATQAPLKNTISDFWRLIWQENIGKVVMLTNLVESGRVKSEQYWSDFEPRQVGHFIITLSGSVELTEYTLREFNVFNTLTAEKRHVHHFHYTTWPDNGVPARASGVLAFRNRIISVDPDCDGPLLVHCSAGIGRTGTYIALDYAVSQLHEEKKVNIQRIVCNLRKQRVNIVPTVEQYGFVYEGVLEAAHFGDTLIRWSEFSDSFAKLCNVDRKTGESRIYAQYQLLQSVRPSLQDEHIQTALQPDNIDKHQNKNIIAADPHRLYLSTHIRDSTDYINAVKVSGYKQKTVFFVTELPFRHTVVDFWRLVYDHACGSAVLLADMDPNDGVHGPYWPAKLGCIDVDPFQLELVADVKVTDNITERTIKISPKKAVYKQRLLKQFHVSPWPLNQDIPSSKSTLLSLAELVFKWQEECGSQPVIVQCRDGVTSCGLFCALMSCLERIEIDQSVDIFDTVRLIRIPRPQFITSMDQYEFCHQILGYFAEREIELDQCL